MIRILILIFYLLIVPVYSDELNNLKDITIEKKLNLSEFNVLIRKLDTIKNNQKNNDPVLNGNNLYFNRSNGLLKLSGLASFNIRDNRLYGEEISVLFADKKKIICKPNAFLDIPSLFGNESRTDIRANIISFNYDANTIKCSGSVQIRDQSGSINSKELNLFLNKNNKLDWFSASSSVEIKMNNYFLKTDELKYLAPKSKMELKGKPKIFNEKNIMTADKIFFWPKEDRILCEPNAKFTFFR